MTRELTWTMALCALAALGGCASERPAVGFARMALSADLISADVLSITASPTNGSAVEVWRSEAPHDAFGPDVIEFTLDAGAYDSLRFDATVGGIPALRGRSEAFTVRRGETTDVEVVVDPFGRLRVIPLGLPALDGVLIAAIPLDPLEGDPDAYPLIADADGFTVDLPTGAYRIELTLPAGLDLITSDALTIDVVSGQQSDARLAYGSPLDPPDVPGAIEAVRVLLDGGAELVTGLPVDLVVEVLDGDGRRVIDYAGEIIFETNAEPGLLDLVLPEPYRFTPEDAGRRAFPGGLVPSLQSLALPARFEIRISDPEADVDATVMVCVRSLIVDC